MAVTPISIEDSALARDMHGLLSVLEELFPVHIQAEEAPFIKALGYIARLDPSTVPTTAPVARPTLYIPAHTDTANAGVLNRTEIRFADDPEVPWPYRGRTLGVTARLHADVHARLHQPGDRILATDSDGWPVWTLGNRDGALVYRTSLAPPYAPDGQDAGLAAGGERFIQALPLFHFLRECSAEHGFSNPPLRAAFIIDDPNLHWPSYGYVNYREIAASARDDRYHVAFATIPLDAWWVDARAAALFRAHGDGLSLAIHGNNHGHYELARTYSPNDSGALLKQALSRIRRLEFKAGVAVSRVMVPPHGACSSRMLAELPRHGFESACISAGSLRAHNAGQTWTNRLGFAPSEIIEGCPVLPRWAFADASDAILLAAAYLGQPLILRGHHQDLRDGLDLFRHFADRINALGEVRWDNLRVLSRLNYGYRIEGARMRVRPLGTHITLDLPDGVREIGIESRGHAWQPIGAATTREQEAEDALVFAVSDGRRHEFVQRSAAASSALARGTHGGLVLRRILTEARDRMRLG